MHEWNRVHPGFKCKSRLAAKEGATCDLTLGGFAVD